MAFKLFVDADVVIDFFASRESYVNPASELFELNEKGEVILFISAVSITNIYYIVRKYLGHKKTIDVIEMLMEMTEIVGTTKKEISQALKNSFSDFEDSVQYSSALMVKGLNAIITRNVKDYKKAKIAVLTPLDFLKLKEKMRVNKS